MEGWGLPAYLLHPMVVHFPIALLTLGLVGGLVNATGRSPAWLEGALPWILGLGLMSLWAALGLGLLAERLAPHVPPAWRVMAEHRRDAWITAWAFSALGLAWAWAAGRARSWLLAGWVMALFLLVMTAHLGAQLVFQYGLGSAQP